MDVEVISISPGLASESRETAFHSRFYHVSVLGVETKPTPCIMKMFFNPRTLLESQTQEKLRVSKTLLFKDTTLSKVQPPRKSSS